MYFIKYKNCKGKQKKIYNNNRNPTKWHSKWERNIKTREPFKYTAKKKYPIIIPFIIASRAINLFLSTKCSNINKFMLKMHSFCCFSFIRRFLFIFINSFRYIWLLWMICDEYLWLIPWPFPVTYKNRSESAIENWRILLTITFHGALSDLIVDRIQKKP